MLHAALAILLLLAPPATPAPPQGTQPAVSIPKETFVAAKDKPADAKSVSTARKTAKKGDTVVIEAKVGGRAEPFVKNRAILMVADRSLRSCDQIPGDTCAKPWDYCCEPPESKRANMMTIQFVGADGKPLKVGAQGAGGLEPLRLVTFEGTVAEIDDKGTFVVHVKRMHVEVPKTKDGESASDAKDASGAGDGGPSSPSKDSEKDSEKPSRAGASAR
jgi:hypothetical protein